VRIPIALGLTASILTLVAGCDQKTAQASSPPAAAQPDALHFADGMPRFDRSPGEKGFWDMPSVSTVVESGVKVDVDANGKLRNLDDASKVAPFQPWALALFKFRQQNGFKDDPMKVCIGPGLPRQMHTPGGLRILQDRNYKRAYLIFGGGNHTWRTIYLDGREPPDPEEVTGTFFGLSVGHYVKDALVADSIGFNTRFWMSNSGLPHTEALHVTETFKRPSHDVLEYEVTIDDPRTYTRPWKSAWTMRWVPGDISEQYCESGRT
jgi:hypothetical protein